MTPGGPAENDPATSLDIAVVGSGISGLAAAWLLAQRHRVTLYESDARLGGHSHTVDVGVPAAPLAVDTGFIVYNEPAYPNLTALFAHLGVATQASEMSFAVSLDDGALEYSGSDCVACSRSAATSSTCASGRCCATSSASIATRRATPLAPA
jgi:predicted NAD/FAD-binding protein